MRNAERVECDRHVCFHVLTDLKGAGCQIFFEICRELSFLYHLVIYNYHILMTNNLYHIYALIYIYVFSTRLCGVLRAAVAGFLRDDGTAVCKRREISGRLDPVGLRNFTNKNGAGNPIFVG